MYLARVWCLAFLFSAAGLSMAIAQTVEEAQPAETGASVADAAAAADTADAAADKPQLGLRYDAVFREADETISRQIDADLIDLDALREAIESSLNLTEIRLSLNDCILLALDRNPDILLAEFEPRKLDGDLLTARGEFDPVFKTDILYNESSTVASQQLIVFGGISSIESYTTTMEAGVAGKLHTGAMYSLSLAMNDDENTFGKFIEEWDGLLTLSLTQPILRGFGPTVNKVRIKQAHNARIAAEAQLKATVMNTAASVVKAYWDLVGAIESVTVRQESLENAERLLHINETRRQIGTAADIDVLQAKAGVATRQSELIAARAAVGHAEDALKQLLDIRDGDLFSSARIIPTDRPGFAPATWMEPGNLEAQVQLSVERALRNRPELQASQIEIENAELEEMRTRNQMLPQLDIVGAYGQGGRDHKPRQVFYGMRQGEVDTMSVGIQGSIPLGNRAARGQHLRAQLGREQAEQRFENVRQGLMVNVHVAMRNVFANQTLVESTRQAREFQEVNVIAEEKRLRLGVTTSYQVLLVQQDLTLAQTQELQSLINYQKALVDLQLAEGTILDNLGVVFEPPDAAKPVGFIDAVTPRWDW